MATLTVTEQHHCIASGKTISGEITHTGAVGISASPSVAGSNTTVTLTSGFDKDVPVFVYLKSDQAVTVVFKAAGGGTVKSITLAANTPWTWRVGDTAWSDDVATIDITNAGATAATVYVEILLDSGTT